MTSVRATEPKIGPLSELFESPGVPPPGRGFTQAAKPAPDPHAAFRDRFAAFDASVRFFHRRARVLSVLHGIKPRGLAWTEAWVQNRAPAVPSTGTLRETLQQLPPDAAREYLVASLADATDEAPDADAACAAARRALQGLKAHLATPEIVDDALMHFEREYLGRGRKKA